jgi:hypothetical protein
LWQTSSAMFHHVTPSFLNMQIFEGKLRGTVLAQGMVRTQAAR